MCSQIVSPNVFAAGKVAPLSLSPHSFSSSSPVGCLDRLFICPAWARKGYCDSKRKLMQKHCPSSCDFCYGKSSTAKEKKITPNLLVHGIASVPFANAS